MMKQRGLFLIAPQANGPLLAAVAAALEHGQLASDALGAQLGLDVDPYLAQQIVELHRHWELRPQPARRLLGRLRTRLAWWLLGPELQQANQVHATLVRLLDSLLAQAQEDRMARRRLEQHLAYRTEEP